MIKRILVKYAMKIITQGYPGKAIVAKLLYDNSYSSIEFLIEITAITRPPYAYCLYYAALLAKRLKIYRISAIEFGVAGGNGLIAIEKLAKRIHKEIGVEIEVYGFDTSEGLPPPQSKYDIPYRVQEGFFPMDVEALKNRLENAQLVLGDVKETVPTFIKKYDPSPIGAIFYDMDYYSSTMNAFQLFQDNDSYYLPRCFMYFDDIVGGPWQMYGNENGELLAIKHFNTQNEFKKIHKNQNLSCRASQPWHHQIYYYHNFNHPQYAQFIGGTTDQKIIMQVLKLR